jgi:hypothetical protein
MVDRDERYAQNTSRKVSGPEILNAAAGQTKRMFFPFIFQRFYFYRPIEFIGVGGFPLPIWGLFH